MGQSTDGILAFGWDLGSIEDDNHWAYSLIERLDDAEDYDDVLREALGYVGLPNPWDELEGKPSEWYRSPDFYGDSLEFKTWLELTQVARDEHRAHEKAALDGFPGAIVTHCSHEYPMFILTLKSTNWCAYRGSPVNVTPGVLSLFQESTITVVAAQLYDVARQLDLQPPEMPRLLLASDWG